GGQTLHPRAQPPPSRPQPSRAVSAGQPQTPAAPAPVQQPQQPVRPVQQTPAESVTASLRLPATVCGRTVPAPAKLPPSGSAPVFYFAVLCFEKQGGSSVIDANTYLYYLQ